MSPTYDALTLPEHVKTVLITGAGGFVGQQLTALLLDQFPDVKLITTDLSPPPSLGASNSRRLKSVGVDLGNVAQVNSLFEGETIGGVFALHGIMSGGSEADFELGYKVNVDSHLNLLRATHAHARTTGQKPVYVFISSLAVYGGPKCRPQDYVVPSVSRHAVSAAAHGGHPIWSGKLVVMTDYKESLVHPLMVSVIQPSTAASSFISGLIREPLQGQRSVCPIAASIDDPIFDNLPVYLSRTKTVIRNIAWGMCMPASRFTGEKGRSINVPGISVTPRQILDALVEHGGKEALELVDFEPDQAVLDIVNTWAGDYDNSDALALGFEVDDSKTGFADAVGDFKKEIQKN
ncbi:hypothetical protein P7C73_g4257, partial [Tremellales sp. Uapishka_1]